MGLDGIGGAITKLSHTLYSFFPFATLLFIIGGEEGDEMR
jgi:hypothetical protein